MNDSLVLGIETSGILCSVAWWQNDKILLEYNIEKRNAHGTLLASLVEEGHKKLNISSTSVDLVAVGSGPGSFTGLRIGMAYAKGFCWGLGIPLVPVTNFEVLFYSVRAHKGPVIALIEARKGYYYVGKFLDGILQIDTRYLVEGRKLINSSNSNRMFVVHEESSPGHFIDLCPNSLKVKQGDYRASVICTLGHQKYGQKEIKDLAEVEPFYVQPFAGVL